MSAAVVLLCNVWKSAAAGGVAGALVEISKIVGEAIAGTDGT